MENQKLFRISGAGDGDLIRFRDGALAIIVIIKKMVMFKIKEKIQIQLVIPSVPKDRKILDFYEENFRKLNYDILASKGRWEIVQSGN